MRKKDNPVCWHSMCIRSGVAPSLCHWHGTALADVGHFSRGYAIAQPCTGSASVQDPQFTSWWHGYPNLDSTKIYTPLTRKMKNVNIKKCITCTMQVSCRCLLVQQKTVFKRRAFVLIHSRHPFDRRQNKLWINKRLKYVRSAIYFMVPVDAKHHVYLLNL